jgi:hypothetical protein
MDGNITGKVKVKSVAFITYFCHCFITFLLASCLHWITFIIGYQCFPLISAISRMFIRIIQAHAGPCRVNDCSKSNTIALFVLNSGPSRIAHATSLSCTIPIHQDGVWWLSLPDELCAIKIIFVIHTSSSCTIWKGAFGNGTSYSRIIRNARLSIFGVEVSSEAFLLGSPFGVLLNFSGTLIRSIGASIPSTSLFIILFRVSASSPLTL